MMSQFELVFIRIGTVIVLYIIIKHGFINRALLDKLRQDLFEIRDDLFDIARDDQSSIDFQTDIYNEFRDFINGTIRFAHMLSYSFALITLLVNRFTGVGEYYKNQKNLPNRLVDSVEDAYTKAKLKAINIRILIAFAWYLLFTSPVFVIHTAALFYASAGSVKKTKQRVIQSEHPFREFELAAARC